MRVNPSLLRYLAPFCLASLAGVAALARTQEGGESAGQEQAEPGPPEPAATQEEGPAGGEEGGEGEEEREKESEEEEEPREGIPVTDELVQTRCAACHPADEKGCMSRISFMRKTPEGWELSLKRMLRLHKLELTPDEARAIVRYLANDHGLARAEAERGLYEVERRVHWSEEQHDEDLRETCGKCHTLGRVLSEQRDEKEWKLLKATHLAFFPLADFQAFRGGRQFFEDVDWESMTEDEASARFEEWDERRGPDRADQVLGELAKSQPLFTPEWRAWEVDRRDVPLEGVWSLVGHEVSRGDVRGTLAIRKSGEASFETEWELQYGDGRTVQRAGKGLLYAGYSWRGRSTTSAPAEPASLREVLLLSEDWNTLRGRIFAGEHDELGMDATLRRHTGGPAIFAVVNGALRVPGADQELELAGADLPADLSAEDFHLGEGVRVTRARRTSAERVELGVDVARGARPGRRGVSMRAHRGPDGVVLYDTVDYVKVLPEEGFARVGGKVHAKQFERFEAVAMNRGLDGELYTDDDFAVRVVEARWSLEEFPIRPEDDDVSFVGAIDEATGVFTPALDGPNPERRWQANNIGDVYVVARCTLTVPERPEPAEEGAAVTEDAPVALVEREFKARGHLLVTIPIYVDWDRYDWDRR